MLSFIQPHIVTILVRIAIGLGGIAAAVLAFDAYRERLIARGEQQCKDRVELARREASSAAQTIVIDHTKEDQARIKELEARASALAAELSGREDHRNMVPLSDACSACRIRREWMRGRP